MQLIETVDGDLYDQTADVFKRTESGQDVWEAYVQVGHTGSKALIIRQRAMEEVQAVRALVRKLRAFMDLVEGATNDRFLPVIEGAIDDQLTKLRQSIGIHAEDKDDKKDEPS